MSYCRWSSRCEDGRQSDVYVYHNVAGGITIHLGGYCPRWWYDTLSRISSFAMDLGGPSWHKTGARKTSPSGHEYEEYAQKGSWWRNPLRRAANFVQHPAIYRPVPGSPGMSAARWSFWWPHWMTHKDNGLPEEEDSHGLSYREAATRLESLRCRGWAVPEYAIKQLYQEDREDPDGPTESEE